MALLDGIRDGWVPTSSTCGANARELLSNMSFTGRSAAKVLVEDMNFKMDRDEG